METKGRNASLTIKNPIIHSICLHTFIFIILAFINIGDENIKQPRYINLTFSEFERQKNEEKSESQQKDTKVIKAKKNKDNSEVDLLQHSDLVTIEIEDTIINKPEIVISDSAEVEGREQYLKFARSLLDSFLISNPSYSKLILIEQIKGLKDSAFALQNLERKINDDLHKYLKENYPEGSDNAINKYTGPGISIPIDDLIDILGGIF